MSKCKMVVISFYTAGKINGVSQENSAYSWGDAWYKFKVLVSHNSI